MGPVHGFIRHFYPTGREGVFLRDKRSSNVNRLIERSGRQVLVGERIFLAACGPGSRGCGIRGLGLRSTLR